MESEDIIRVIGLIRNLIILILILYGPKLGRFILQKYPNSVTLKIIFSDDVGKKHYYIWIVISLVLSFVLAAITQIDLLILFFVSLFLVLVIMVKYYQKKGIYSINGIDNIPLPQKIELKKGADSGNRLNTNCINHLDKTAMAVCCVCGKPFCYDCLLEGNDFYYCVNKECQKEFYNKSNTQVVL